MNSRSAALESVRAHASGPDPIRLMKVLTSFYPGGTERQVLNLVRGMDRRKFELEFACLDRMGDTLAAFEALDLPISEFRIRRLYHPQCFLQQLRFASLLRRRRTQILHSYNFYANMFCLPAARLAGVPVVLASVRDRGVYLTPAQKQLQRRVLGLADQVLVNADAIREWLLEQGLKEDRITVIRNGIDLSRYHEAIDPSPVRQELGIPAAAPVAVLVARLNPSKGFDDFIRAAALVIRHRPDARFLLVGADLRSRDGVATEDTAYREALQRLVASLGLGERIVFMGHRNDVPEILAAADVSVLPSHSEGLSNTLLESMAAGLPSVATDVGGNPELISDGVNGRLVPVRSPEPLAEAILDLMGNPGERQRLGAQARRMAWSDYSLPAMAGKTQELYREQLGRARRALA